MEALPKASSEQEAKRRAFAARTAGPAEAKPVKLADSAEQALEQQQQAGAEGDGGAAPGAAELAAKPATTQPLPDGVRKRLEKSFGCDFSDVTLRMGGTADEECDSRGAVAFTAGKTITVSKNAGSPDSPGFFQILAHEAAHVVQQKGGKDQDGAGSAAAGAAGTKADAEAQKDPKKDPQKDAQKNGASAGGGSAEGEADAAAAAVAGGGAATVEQKAAPGTPQNKDASPKNVNPNTIKIPLPGGKSIDITPPNSTGDWSVSSAVGPKIKAPVKAEKKKYFHRNIPTPFFGLCLHLGAEVGFSAKVGEVSLGTVKVSYSKAKDEYSLTIGAKTGASVEVFGALSAGVAADLWIVEAGVGLKAKLALSASAPLTGSVFGSYSPKSGSWSLGGKLSLTSLEIALKAAVGLFAYYDAWGVSTYTKDWWLYERTLGKLTLPGFDLGAKWSSQGGWQGSFEPKDFSVQNLDGNIKSLYPSKSR